MIVKTLPMVRLQLYIRDGECGRAAKTGRIPREGREYNGASLGGSCRVSSPESCHCFYADITVLHENRFADFRQI